ncbi:AMP-dependent synthetase and ligase family protein [Striga asiatica]|uniref:AMP-dependent synthetase and ligase family protein n=1 Tax=Striga asiatica TaxID=4170 RepID=A0A5A7QIL4_STRAF|nr:AMP-dependent synthetase and ligase family protein [Striga asiatica]
MAGDAAECKLAACCISHEFYKAALKHPDKISVIHASGFARSTGDLLDGDRQPRDGCSKLTASSSRPPVYEGDECFTFSAIHSAVEKLSSRLWLILHAGDDSRLLKTEPGKVVVVLKPERVRLTYFEFFGVNVFRDNSEHVAKSLQYSSQSVQHSSKFRKSRIPKVVGIYMEPSVDYIVAVLSVLRCGEAFMPLDPSWPKSRILSVISSSKADLIVGFGLSSEGNCCHKIDNLKWLIDDGSCPVLHFSMNETIKEQSQSLLLGWPCESEGLRSFCYLMYTSGSSGKPKGVCGTETVSLGQHVSIVGLLNRFSWMQEMYPLHEGDVVLFKTAVGFIDHMQEFLGALLSTCTLVIPPFNQLKENLYSVVDFLQGYFINRLVAVPSLMRAILPSLQSPRSLIIQGSLKLLILSGEVLHLPLCKMLLELLPRTSILNLYGSTEVTGDCTYFDCTRLPQILEKEVLSSVPIGLPVSNCDVVLVGEEIAYQGEIYVGGVCVAAGYFDYPRLISLADGDVSPEHDNFSPNSGCRFQHYFRTGDFARKLPSGDLVFLGRKDRTVKVNGQRVALEEIEGAFREHPNVVDAAVLSREVGDEILFIEAHVVREETFRDEELLKSSLRNWVLRKLPHVMIPSRIFFTRSLPLTPSGKVDYLSLTASGSSDEEGAFKDIHQDHLIEVIKKVFSDALMVENVSVDDNFFEMGGSSLSAAYASFKLGIHMKLLYTFPTPSKLQMALLSSGSSLGTDAFLGVNLRKSEMAPSRESNMPDLHGSKPKGILFDANSNKDFHMPKKLKIEPNTCSGHSEPTCGGILWNPNVVHTECSFSRCNTSTHVGQCEESYSGDTVWSNIPRDGKGFMQELWKVDLGSCVDASPLVVCKGSDIYLFIGSHSHKFFCINGRSGIVQWESKLEGRVECSATILDDLSQVVVGCYEGNIYFLQFSNGNICWRFRTDGETLPFKTLWKQDMGAPAFGSLSINYSDGNIICCLVDGTVNVLSSRGSIIWKVRTGGPIFAGPCTSRALPSQETGNIIWKHTVGRPITSSAYVDEFSLVKSDKNPSSPDRLMICVCDSSGSIHVLRVFPNAVGGVYPNTDELVHEFARLDLNGDIFSSPLMIGGRIFVGCRDDHVYSIQLEVELA